MHRILIRNLDPVFKIPEPIESDLILKKKITSLIQKKHFLRKSTTRYDMLDFNSYIENFEWIYLLIRLKILQKYALDLQHLTFNYQIFPLQIFYITFEI